MVLCPWVMGRAFFCQLVVQNDGKAFAVLVVCQQAVLFQVFAPFFCKGFMRAVGFNAGAVVLGHGEAVGVYDVASEEGPGAADVGLAGMDRAALSVLEEDAGAVLACTDLQLAQPVFAVFGDELFSCEVKGFSDAGKVLGADNNAALAMAAAPAHLAGEDRGVVHRCGYDRS